MPRVLGLGKLDGDVGGDRSLGGRGRAKRLDRDLAHVWRRVRDDIDMSMTSMMRSMTSVVVAGH